MSSTLRQSDGGSAFTSFYSIIPHGLGAFRRTSILELRGRSYPKRCPFGGISAPFARIPVYVQSGYAFIHDTEDRPWRHSKPASDWFYCESILHASSRGLIYRTFLILYTAETNSLISFAIHLLSKGRSFLAHLFVR